MRQNLIAKVMIIHQKETGVVAAVGIKNGGMMKEEIRGNTVNHQDITEVINIQKIILYMLEILTDTNRVGVILMTQRLSASVVDMKHQTMNVNHVTLIKNVMEGLIEISTSMQGLIIVDMTEIRLNHIAMRMKEPMIDIHAMKDTDRIEAIESLMIIDMINIGHVMKRSIIRKTIYILENAKVIEIVEIDIDDFFLYYP